MVGHRHDGITTKLTKAPESFFKNRAEFREMDSPYQVVAESIPSQAEHRTIRRSISDHVEATFE